MSRFATLLAASTVLFAGGPALAVDGEVLISQAQANAGNVTPGDAAGFPVTITRSGSYKLSGNLEVPAGRVGIAIEQADVTVDLNGFAIVGTPYGQANSAVSGRVNNITVRNGTVAGFSDYAVFFAYPGAFTVVENLRIVDNRSYGLTLSNDARVTGNTISNNGSGIYCGFRCHIEGNVVTGSTTGQGINLSLPGGTVLGNVIAANRGVGISTNGASAFGNNTLTGNNNGGPQTSGGLFPLHPNSCLPVCP
jgi:hypothetical protein